MVNGCTIHFRQTCKMTLVAHKFSTLCISSSFFYHTLFLYVFVRWWRMIYLVMTGHCFGAICFCVHILCFCISQVTRALNSLEEVLCSLYSHY